MANGHTPGGLGQQSHCLPVPEARLLGPNCRLDLAALGCPGEGLTGPHFCQVFCGRCQQDCHLHRTRPLSPDVQQPDTHHVPSPDSQVEAPTGISHILKSSVFYCSTNPQTGYIFLESGSFSITVLVRSGAASDNGF